jgi:hypothetical protein
MLPFVWTLFAVCAVGGVIMIAAYWLDVQERPDLTLGRRMAWSAATLLFPLSIPVYAMLGGGQWPLALRIGSFLPTLALLLFLGFAFGLLR